MSDIVIKAENLGKKYVIGHRTERAPYLALRDVLMQSARTLWSKTKDLAAGKPIIQGDTMEEVWALKDVSFEIRRGEAVGIIGRNGAGKSTVLKILSRITEPSAGRVTIKDRVATLLEVGTGFHPELTGRENIYLNGTILGMTRAEIKSRFDEIVAFAEVDKYLDTPVKRFSSGMYVRLAFAVAAHLEAEILVVDEVLAVGDSEFQKKCLGKMSAVAKDGRTVLFVSHNMAAIQQLCERGMVLSNGELIFYGSAWDAIHNYSQNAIFIARSDLSERRDRQGSQWLRFVRVALYDAKDNELKQAVSGQCIFIRFYYESSKEKVSNSVLVAFNIQSSQGNLLANLNSVDTGQSRLDIYKQGYFECCWPKFNLKSGNYSCTLFCSIGGEIVDWIQNAFILSVEDGDYYESGKMIDRQQGEILIDHAWAFGRITDVDR